MNRHTALFWFGPEGPEFCLGVIRMSLVFSSIYVGYFMVCPHESLAHSLAREASPTRPLRAAAVRLSIYPVPSPPNT